MHDPKFNPTGRFSGLADLYAKNRPSYPAEAIEFIIAHCNLEANSLLVDVGCGTGISARLFAERGIQVVGIEPNDDMRLEGERSLAVGLRDRLKFVHGTAEATGIADGAAQVVLAAQAFHWFRPEESLQEFKRILKKSGWVALMWNERDESDKFTGDYGEQFRLNSDAASVELSRQGAGAPLMASSLFVNLEKKVFKNEQQMNEEGLLGRAFSASYAPKDKERAQKLESVLRELFRTHQRNGMVTMKYETTIYLGQKGT